ncbi:MAG: carbamoyl-phosphate synthase large subunit [Myxococcaceae bacterium]|nr:carbamoyl-phosphate synthase large subunit [Myxococcaceae bacterium]MCA3012964.1 carbamoyl-phosphate synthase large subunit [Myxococcaceae bacterium]
MPRRPDIKKVLLIGSGPIVIGQACEFDYSGTQAVKALKDEGIEVVLLNSNPATIMTDPEFAHRTYVEPITVEAATRIIEQERPDSLLPTMGGQTALNLAKALAEAGVLQRYGVRLIGAQLESINKAEDRQLFKQAMERIGLEVPKAGIAHSLDEAFTIVRETGYPAIIRPAFTLGGTGGGIAYDEAQFRAIVEGGLAASPVRQVQIDQSVLGWKEYELEVVRDRKDNVVIICSIENFDPMGVHTGDSITVAPAQTLTDKEYQRMRSAAIAIMREIGVDTGGSNVQFGVDPKTGRMVVIEMNPRVSRSSALASKATGYPIAKIAAKLAIGYTLDELKNDITRDTPASFEPSIDYVVTKIPKFNFEKFQGASKVLGTMMRSVGEVMAIGRTFRESFFKAVRSLEQGRLAIPSKAEATRRPEAELVELLEVPTPDRPWALFEAFQRGWTVEQVFAHTAIDPWFLRHLEALVSEFNTLAAKGSLEQVSDAELEGAKSHGFSDAQLAKAFGVAEAAVREARWQRGLRPVYKRVDTCAAEFEAYTPYLYSTYEEEDEAPPTSRQKVVILGSGPIRIGQGIEFDYCCVHAAFALREAGFETIMVNCNPETVSTDYDTSDRLYFEPLTLEDVLEIIHREKPLGVIVQFGGQTPLKLSKPLEAAGVPILGTSPDAIDIAEDRERFSKLVEKLRLKQPENGVARSPDEAFRVAGVIGYPVMVRPSYVLGGRAMEVVHDQGDLERYMREAVLASPEHPVLIDRFLRNATEVDLDLVCDSTGATIVGGILEHVEEAGVHSGDAACVMPPHSLGQDVIERLKDISVALALELKVVGLMNVQFAVQGKAIYVLEVNPRASRTVPFISKATGVPLARVASLCMVGRSLASLGLTRDPEVPSIAVKESVFPFARFSNTDVILGPEMKSTGEVMGIDVKLDAAFAKSQLAAGTKLPKGGDAFVSVKDDDKPGLVDLCRRLRALGFGLLATGGTHEYLKKKGIESAKVNKVLQGSPHIVDRVHAGEVALVFNTTAGKKEISDSFSIRRESLLKGVPHFTTLEAARMVVAALEAQASSQRQYRPIQEWLKARR